MAGLSYTTLSDLLGYTSIACWLGAQFPQVVENIRNQSTEGLALPFLANWLLGDLSNLIGCILTHQLPFQTWLAIYFCCVDFSLFGQYFYYQQARFLKPQHLRTRSRTASRPRTISFDRGTAHYRTLSTVATHVATAAALAAQEGGQGAPQKRPRSASAVREGSQDPDAILAHEEEDYVDEDALAALADSFHSEGGRSSRRKRVSWSGERLAKGQTSPRIGPPSIPPSLRITTSETDANTRGRARERDPTSTEVLEGVDWTTSPTASPISPRERTSSRASRRSVGLVFLSVWALFGVGSVVNGALPLRSAGSTNVGRVVFADTLSMPSPVTSFAPAASFLSLSQSPETAVIIEAPSDTTFNAARDEEPYSERVLGRFFAWLCTTLYLTSRLPQIWKNYARKSVEGLSMALFIFAFLGNVFYVASILTSPKVYLPPPQSTAFLKESVPYLLGSAGTLCFDITIVGQSFIYKPKTHHRGRSGSTARSRILDEEHAGLLRGDALEEGEGNEPSKDRTSSTQDS